MDWRKHVSMDPNACHGKPCITGARILTTLLHALKGRGEERGVALLCLGGGEAVAMAVEMP